jgi:hypothetical protein
MVDFWMDADSLIVPHRGPYPFESIPQFWDFLEEMATEGIIASPQFILDVELSADPGDEQDALEQWAKQLKGVMFLDVDDHIQTHYTEVVDYVAGNNRYRPYWVTKFLDGGDPWMVAYAKALGGRIVTFETPQPEARKPKIPDVAGHFGVNCITLYNMLRELGFRV